jgi:hypothetical protein
MNFDDATIEQILKMAGWQQTAPFTKLWHRAGQTSYMSLEDALKSQIALPEALRLHTLPQADFSTRKD